MADINKSINDTTKKLEVLGNTFQKKIADPVLGKFLPLAQNGIQALSSEIEAITPVAAVATSALEGMLAVKEAAGFIKTMSETAESVGEFILKAASYAAAADTATGAQLGLNAAMTASPVGWMAVGVSALVGVVALLASNIEVAKSDTDILIDSASDLKDELNKSQESISATINSADESIASVGASSAVTSGYALEAANNLKKLIDSGGAAAGNQAEMAQEVEKLNILFPEMGLEIDSVTGKINMGMDAIYSYIDNMKQMSLAEAYNRAAADSYDELVQAQMKLNESQEAQTEIANQRKAKENELEKIREGEIERVEALRQAEKDYQKAMYEGADNLGEYEGKIYELQNSYVEVEGRTLSVVDAEVELQRQIGELTEAEKGLQEEIDEQSEAVAGATETADGYIEKSVELKEEAQKAAEAERERVNAMQAKNEASLASIEIAGQELEAYQNLTEEQQQMAVDFTNSVLAMEENLQNSISSQLGLFETLNTGAATSMEEILAGLDSQINGVETWEQNLNTLISRGINEDLIQTLIEAGPQAGSAVQAIVDAGEGQISELNDKWALKEQILNVTNDAGQALMGSGMEKIAEGFAGMSELLNASGADGVLGLVEGMQAAQQQALDAGEDLGIKTIESIDSGLGVNSPSWKTKDAGLNLNLGLSQGMRENMGIIRIAAGETGRVAVGMIETGLNLNAIKGYGSNAASALAEGILKGRSTVIAAATEIAAAAVNAAKEKLEINSPSRVFREMGINSMEGYSLGIKNARSEVSKAVSRAMDFSDLKKDGVSADSLLRENEQNGLTYSNLVRAFSTALHSMDLSMKLNGREFGRVLKEMGVAVSG
ncbi:hypothetical protein [Wansuia hejianensis]|uniref:Uncharacterized protein n=1 Tax=Wansuia hejianensis TaxID=2763667 RepID=A0A7G9GHG3_9FIRM|nr:hypothetical protein [Wansuia hejianensis]QNM10245.1 hypothetical protein H9Q79_08275 [Wansuia hejianensis]